MSELSFADLVAQLHIERLKDLNSKPSNAKFHWNSRGIRETVFTVPAKIETETGLTNLGKIPLYYADQNPAGKSYDASMVRSGKWNKHDVGWLWAYINHKRVWLSKICPTGITQITNGIIKDGTLFFRR